MKWDEQRGEKVSSLCFYRVFVTIQNHEKIWKTIRYAYRNVWGLKAYGGWQRCADENVAQKCDAHLAVNNAEALLNMRKEDLFL